jgi:ubiquinol-cytochrome c reductase cytochrome b subunit
VLARLAELARRVAAGIEERTGARPFASWTELPVPGGARFGHVSGPVLLLLVALQALSGFVLALHYAPSVGTAWASIVFFEERIRAGAFIRGLHSWGASAVVLALVFHFAQVAWRGAYKKPREVTWTLGLLLGVLVLVFAHTGYALPWDQKGYWSTKVATGIAGATPVVGPLAQRVAVGGEDFGNLTLTHFYAVHVILLPVLLVLLLGLHLKAFRKNGPTPPEGVVDAKPGGGEGGTAPTQALAPPWFPAQTFRNLVAFLVVGGALALLAWQKGAPLEAPADPAGGFQPRPEWYFLPLYQLLKFFPSRLEFVGSEVIPGIVFTAFLLLPWIDRGPSRAPSARRLALAIAFVPLGVAVVFGSLSVLEDAGSADLKRHRDAEAKDARLARRLFRENGGVPPEGPLALLDRYPPRLGERVFHESCASCHDGPDLKGPDLRDYLSPRWLELVIRDPAQLYGKRDTMGKADAHPDELRALAVYMASLEAAQVPGLDASLVARGKTLFAAKECDACHDVGGRGGAKPGTREEDLTGYGSEEWLVAFIQEPWRFFGKKNDAMPAFADKLTANELHALAVYLRGLKRPASEDD